MDYNELTRRYGENYNELTRRYGESLTDWTLRWLQRQVSPFTEQQQEEDRRTRELVATNPLRRSQ